MFYENVNNCIVTYLVTYHQLSTSANVAAIAFKLTAIIKKTFMTTFAKPIIYTQETFKIITGISLSLFYNFK